jgi:hypothetical protein
LYTKELERELGGGSLELGDPKLLKSRKMQDGTKSKKDEYTGVSFYASAID